MKEYLIGTGGWAYFHVPRLHPLTAYSRAFNFVEVNSTFYQLPGLKKAERWRKLVPEDFQFAVRASRLITHSDKFQLTPKSTEALESTKQICAALRANVLHFQTPPWLKLDRTMIDRIRDVLSSAETPKVRLALEVRGKSSAELPPGLLKVMQDRNVVHSVDLSKGEEPAYESDMLYTRLFGKGEHNVYQPTDEELKEVDGKASKGNFERVVMSFHFVRMYKDAARLKIYKQTGKFPQITKSTGLTSLEEVLSEDAPFPSTKEDLMQSQGWKLFDVREGERIRANDVLQKLPERTYQSIREITAALKSVET